MKSINYYNEIKNKLIDNEIYARVKDYSKERNKVLTYFEIGKLLNDAGNKYGDNIIGKYSEKLVIEVGKNYNKRTLFRMKQFYILFKDEIVSPVATQLSWSHYQELLPLKDINMINYYISISLNENLSRNDLRRRIKSKEYERLDNSTKNKLITNKETTVSDFIKNPIVIRNKYFDKQISEKVLQQLILEDISGFMKELGSSFSFIDKEYKIKLGNSYNYIDILLYNIKYKCYVVVELKITELKSEYIGQITKYMNYIDKNIKTFDEDYTIGIIICKKNNKFVIEYCSDSRIFFKEFVLV